MPKRSRNYEEGLGERLKDRRHAVNYLNAAAQESDEALLLALKDVVEAQKGMTRISKEAKINRENLYRMLSGIGNPQYSSFRSLLKALHLSLEFREAHKTLRRRVALSSRVYTRRLAQKERSRPVLALKIAPEGAESEYRTPRIGALSYVAVEAYGGSAATSSPASPQGLSGMPIAGANGIANSLQYQFSDQRRVSYGESERIQAAP